MSTKANVGVAKLTKFISTNVRPEFVSLGGYVMIGGLPNVGKSTIINSLRRKETDIDHTKKSGAKVGAVPCITKSISGFKIMTDPNMFVLDTPGIIMPKIRDNSEDGLKLTLTACIRDGIVDPHHVADYLLYVLNKEGQFRYLSRYLMKETSDDINAVLTAVKARYQIKDYE